EKMHAFLRGDADVLVSTTIIESGLDIPQANTLIVERADTLGHAQLYQIRGRVGRSDVTAHAYLFYPDMSELTPEARARLATLADHTELGAGFAIAMRDLEIRGAGNLLGDEQSGHVAALGFELYVELLAEAVAELSGERRIAARPVRVDARVDAYVPAEYIESEALKIDLHRRLALTEGEDELRELQAATEDRFGPLPEPVENLFLIQEAKLKLARVGADYLVFRGGKASVGQMVLGSAELRDLRRRVDTAVYTTANREVSLREDGFTQEIARDTNQFSGGTDARYEKAVKQQGLTDQQAREEIRAQLVSQALFKKLTSSVKVGDADIKAYYNSHKSQYGQPESRDVRHI